MTKPVLVGAVLYDPKVSIIWDIIRDFFEEQDCPIDVVFYTNYDSRKGLEIEENPCGAIAIHWPILQRQVRISGAVEKTSTEESQTYFDSRPRGSRIGAWASDQSSVLRGRDELERRFRETQERFSSGDVPLPPFWGGYRVIPETIEFWQGRANRLHDRLRFTRGGAGWTIDRLYP